MRVLLLNSGGLDSAMIAKWLHGQGVEVWSLHCDTNSENAAQLKAAAQETADRYCANHFVSTIDFGQSSSYLDEAGKQHQLPMVSLVTASIGAVYARLNGINETYIGMRDGIADERIDLLNEMINGVTYDYAKPFVNLPLRESHGYTDNARILAIDLADLEYTHSCPYSTPCGICPKCLQRAEIWTS